MRFIFNRLLHFLFDGTMSFPWCFFMNPTRKQDQVRPNGFLEGILKFCHTGIKNEFRYSGKDEFRCSFLEIHSLWRS